MRCWSFLVPSTGNKGIALHVQTKGLIARVIFWCFTAESIFLYNKTQHCLGLANGCWLSLLHQYLEDEPGLLAPLLIFCLRLSILVVIRGRTGGGLELPPDLAMPLPRHCSPPLSVVHWFMAHGELDASKRCHDLVLNITMAVSSGTDSCR